MKQGLDNQPQAVTLKTAERALAFMEVVAQATRPPRVKDVAARLGLNITTGYHMLNTLQRAGYVTRDGDGTLRIGGRAAVLYQGLLRHFVLGRDLHPVIEQLAATTGETAYLCSLSGHGVVIQTLVEGTHAVRVTGLYIGFSGSEHLRASGKAVLAYLPDTERDSLLRNCMGELTVSERAAQVAALEAELAHTRDRGWAVDEGKFADGVCCIAGPFFSSAGTVAGSVAISAPATRYADANERFADAVCGAARKVSNSLGYHGEPYPATTGT